MAQCRAGEIEYTIHELDTVEGLMQRFHLDRTTLLALMGITWNEHILPNSAKFPSDIVGRPFCFPGRDDPAHTDYFAAINIPNAQNNEIDWEQEPPEPMEPARPATLPGAYVNRSYDDLLRYMWFNDIWDKQTSGKPGVQPSTSGTILPSLLGRQHSRYTASNPGHIPTSRR